MPTAKLNPSRIPAGRLAGIETDLPSAPAAGPWPTEVLLFTQVPVGEARGSQIDAADAMRRGAAPGHRLLLTEHPPTFPNAPPTALPLGWTAYPDRDLALGALYVPGMLTAWLTLHLDHWIGGAAALGDALAALVMRVCKDFGIETAREAALPNQVQIIAADGRPIAWASFFVNSPIAQAYLALNTNADQRRLEEIGIRDQVSMSDLGVPVQRQNDVRAALLQHYETIFGSRTLIPQRAGARTAKPPWLRVKLPLSAATRPVHDAIRERGLHTVCESARCPNQGECWGHGTATFMINGDVCTRSCSFCAIFTGRPKPLDPDEPRRAAEAARDMGLRYAVVTAVNRDELPDGGAAAFAATIRALREAVPGIRVEVLIPDFRGAPEALDLVFAERPDVLNHNVETVPRLYPRVRPQADYRQSLDVIAAAHRAGLVAKSGFMLGLGEEDAEVEALLAGLRAAGVAIVTIGQYLRPSEFHHPVVRYATPGEFARWRAFGLSLGFQTVQSGPLVRSSYHAHESFAASDSA